jgi:hypothetical protein
MIGKIEFYGADHIKFINVLTPILEVYQNTNHEEYVWVAMAKPVEEGKEYTTVVGVRKESIKQKSWEKDFKIKDGD